MCDPDWDSCYSYDTSVVSDMDTDAVVTVACYMLVLVPDGMIDFSRRSSSLHLLDDTDTLDHLLKSMYRSESMWPFLYMENLMLLIVSRVLQHRMYRPISK
jgi:hypothetical protein